MIRLYIAAAGIAVLLLLGCPPAGAAASDSTINVMQAAQLASAEIGEAAKQSLGRQRPAGWMARELPADGYMVNIRVRPVSDPAGLSQEVLISLDSREAATLYCDSLAQGYLQGDEFVNTCLIRNLVWVVQDAALAQLQAGEPWNDPPGRGSASWPKGLTRAGFERIMERSVQLQAADLHVFVYSDSGDNIEIEIDQVLNSYSLQAMLAPELPLAGSLLREIDVERRFVQYAALAVQTRPGRLGWLDPNGNTVVLPYRPTDRQQEEVE